jgi:hypothetical protein
MAFGTGYLKDFNEVGAGEEYGVNNRVLGHRTYEDKLVVGRFAKVASGSLDNLDGTESPVIAGVVLRSPTTAVEADGTIDASLTTGSVSYMQNGLVTVAVKTGQTPSYKGAVFACNAGDANDGMGATGAEAGDNVATGAIFIEEIQTGVWLIEQK